MVPTEEVRICEKMPNFYSQFYIYSMELSVVQA
jgi:hypothetical protein